MNIHATIQKLLHREMRVDEIQGESVINLRAIGRQFALMYRHSKDKESIEAKHILGTLIGIRKTVKEKLGVVDMNIQRFEQEKL